MTPATRLQNKNIKQAIEYLDGGDHVFLESPTGSGKSRQFSMVAKIEAQKKLKVLILSNRKNLIKQAKTNISRWSNGALSASAGMDGKIDQSGDIVVCTVQTARTLSGQLDHYDRLIIDEAHHATLQNTEYSDVIKAMKIKNPNLLLMGASATPPDNAQELVPELAQSKRIIVTFEEAIEAKLIDLPKTITPTITFGEGKNIAVIVSKARDKAGTDADLGGISKQVKQARGDDWPENALYHLERHLGERRTLAYFDTKKDAEAFVKEAKNQNIDVDFIHSGRKKSENDKVIERFNQKDLRILASVDMISEGYDVDAEAVMIDKTTTSKKEYRQIIGRCARSYGDDKINKSIVLDLGASTYLYGEIEAQAAMNNIRGKLDTKVMSHNDILPEGNAGKNKIWIEIDSDKTKTYATAIDGQLIYVVPMNDRYAAFTSYKDRKGHHFEMLAIDGERKGMPTRDGFGRWAEDAVRRNERHLARLSSANSTDRLEAMVTQDWTRSENSVKRSLDMMAQHAPPPIQLQQAQYQART